MLADHKLFDLKKLTFVAFNFLKRKIEEFQEFQMQRTIRSMSEKIG